MNEAYEYRPKPNGKFDEFVARDCKYVHFEMMDDTLLWIGVDDKDGNTHHFNISSPKKLKINTEIDEN